MIYLESPTTYHLPQWSTPLTRIHINTKRRQCLPLFLFCAFIHMISFLSNLGSCVHLTPESLRLSRACSLTPGSSPTPVRFSSPSCDIHTCPTPRLAFWSPPSSRPGRLLTRLPASSCFRLPTAYSGGCPCHHPAHPGLPAPGVSP